MTAFPPPGPGHWALDRSHYPGGTTRLSKQLMTAGMDAGMKTVLAELGMPAQTLRAAFVNGFMYTRLVPLIAPDKPATRLPPLWVLKMATRLHPEFRRRNRSAVRNLAQPPAPAVVARWSTELKPRLVATNRAFQATDPAEMTDVALGDHADALVSHLAEMAELHFWLHGYDLGPIAIFVSTVQGWGIEPAEAVAALAGASPSTTEPRKLLVAIREELTSNANVPTSLDDVRQSSPRAAALLDEYLADRRHLLVTRYDIDGLTLAELPEVVLTSILTAEPPAPDTSSQTAAQLRDRLPGQHQAEFDQLLDMARSVMDMRDDNGPITFQWPAGLLRRALLEIGRRLVSAGRARSVEHVFELDASEIAPLLNGSSHPTADALAARAAERHAEALLDPPPTLGPLEPQPPLSVLPAALQTLVQAVEVALVQMGMSGTLAEDPLAGTGIGATPYRGRVCRADSPEAAIDAMEPGDVLVIRATSPAFNVILSIAGAVVTADGGPLSHAAVLARELGIPAVVGARGALGLTNGAMVEVDPVRGTVRLLQDQAHR